MKICRMLQKSAAAPPAHFLTVLIRLSAFALAQGALEWVKPNDQNICAGIDTECTDVACCTKTAYGPCTNTTEPAFHLESSFVGMAFVNDHTLYQTTASHVKTIPPFDDANNGYRDFSGEKTASGGTYAFTMNGLLFGRAPQTVGGYVGIASHFGLSGSISENSMDVYTSSMDGTNAKARVMRNDSAFGAPDGPFNVCISPVSGSSCGAAKTFTPGTYKFSIFGYTMGANYTAGTTPAALELAAVNYMGVRMKLKTVGVTVSSISFNDDAYSTFDALGSNDVTSMKLTSAEGTLTISFPTQYNLGVSVPPTTPTATHNVKIKVMSNDAESVFIDYLFNFADMDAEGKWFMYDPDVTATVASTTTTVPLSHCSTYTPGILSIAAAASLLAAA